MPGLIQTDPEPHKLILCFDGTGNAFTGSNADTNVVKILNKLDRQHPMQYHYYQTGVGTYDVNEKSVNKTWIGGIRSSISQTIDQGFGTTFDAHVMAGYRFLMRYYSTGDKIYLFGFSRGAFTARFLARMIHTVGLLCRGNEELVPFAYRLYQRYLAGEIVESENNQTKGNANPAESGTRSGHDTDSVLVGEDSDGTVEHRDAYELARDEITAFSNTFCRQEPLYIDGKGKEVLANVKVFFLGMWDCVNSVAVLEGEPPRPVGVKGTAHFVRHAVAVDERRVKFKPALIDQERPFPANENIKEVWFPGGHGDVGGGWPAVRDQSLDKKHQMTRWQYLKNIWTTRKAKVPTSDVRTDPFQMSDIPLAWMIRELELVAKEHPEAAVKWSNNARGFKRAYEKNHQEALRGYMHDALSFGRGTALLKVLLWKFMEWLPFITRYELNSKGSWIKTRFPLNKGATRDIPKDAVLHESIRWRLLNDVAYNPQNNHGENEARCLNQGNDSNIEGDLKTRGSGHQEWRFKNAQG